MPDWREILSEGNDKGLIMPDWKEFHYEGND